jgi:Family of unknown function (DUF6101)
MAVGGSIPAGSSRILRLDPMALPVRFPAFDGGADERVRLVELHRERVIVRRAVRGMRMAVSVPVSAFLGVAIRIVPPDAQTDGAIAVILEHRDPALSIPVFLAADGTDVVAEWQLWAQILDCPLLVADAEGELREPFRRLGSVRVATVVQRRRRHGPIRKRRPFIQFRRKLARMRPDVCVHRGEREIIARN